MATSSKNKKTLVTTMKERGKTYGEFSDIAELSQKLKHVMKASNPNKWERMDPDKLESLEMIQHKIARILIGDPDYKDNWHDIQGYAKLAEDRCK